MRFQIPVFVSCVVLLASAGSALADTDMSPGATGGAGQSAQSSMNPALSLDGLFSASQFSRGEPLVFDGGHDPRQSGFNLQQVELTAGANVDPYFRGDANIVFTKEGVEVEEAYATTLSLPWDLQARAGQFLTLFGRQNPTHPHAWDFADMPLVNGRMFGGDGLRNPGAQLSWLAPLPIYSELIASAQNSNGETAVSFRGDGGTMRALSDCIVLLRSNNFVSLSDDLSLNFGASLATGPNSTSGTARTKIWGGDVYLRYRKPESLSFVTLTVEAMRRIYDLSTGDSQAKDWGWYAQLMYRLPEGFERWHVGARYDWVSEKPTPVVTSSMKDSTGATIDRDTSRRFRVSPVVTFYPSEFSKLRLQYDYDKPRDLAATQHAVHLQIEFLIGSHGAHKF